MSKKLVVTVHWMDDKTEIFDDVSGVHIADGLLTFRERRRWLDGGGSAESWNLSLANMRSYSADWVKRQ